MAGLNETPRGNRVHIAFFGLRNAGKSTLVNAFSGQPLAIVSDVAGTTTDPVSKAMEILPLGPCLITDTAGLDDEGELGAMRVEKSLGVLETTDIAVWVRGETAADGGSGEAEARERFLAACKRRNVTVLEYRRGDSVEALKARIAAVKLDETPPELLDGLVRAHDCVVCVVPIDESAPKSRLILPQQQVIRECLDRHLPCLVCQPEELEPTLAMAAKDAEGETLVVTDSQAFGAVSRTVGRFRQTSGRNLRLTSFSILFARQKGDLAAYAEGLGALPALKDGDTVLIAEGCTHHRQCNDIGSVKIPKALAKLTGKRLKFEFASGAAFPSPLAPFALVVQCGGCMLTRREVLRRIGVARDAGVPIVNYGMLLAAANGMRVEDVLV
ncbi:MAG: GTPase [Kiritimatiellia bacterium]